MEAKESKGVITRVNAAEAQARPEKHEDSEACGNQKLTVAFAKALSGKWQN